MATRTDFTDDEWKALQKGVTGAGMMVSLGDRDFTDSFGEASALAKFLGKQHEENGSALMRDVASVRGTGFGMTDSPQEVEAETHAALAAALSTLAAKAPEEIEAYKRLVLDVAVAVAEAKGGVKPGETAVIDRLEETLGQP